MNVIVRGPLLSVTGYGVHSRQVWQWARSKGWNVYASIVPWGTCTYHINPDSCGGIIGDVMQRSDLSRIQNNADLSLQIQLPDEWDENLAKKNVGITAGIEADRCNPAWLAKCRLMDRVIVPSEYSKLSFLNAGLSKDIIHNVPEAITCDFSQGDGTEEINNMLDGLSTDFNFLVFGQLTNPMADCDRKNTANCIKWLCEAFEKDKDVGIVIKTNMGRLTQEDFRACQDIVTKMCEVVRPGLFPKVHLLHGLINEREIGALYKHDKIKALVAPTRGEGWGLPILDAAASGLPVIATGYSGHVDFMKHVRYLDLKYTLKTIPDAMVDGRIWVPGARWAEPAEHHFKSRVNKFRKSPTIPAEWAAEGAAKINEHFNIQSVLKKYDEALEGII